MDLLVLIDESLVRVGGDEKLHSSWFCRKQRTSQ